MCTVKKQKLSANPGFLTMLAMIGLFTVGPMIFGGVAMAADAEGVRHGTAGGVFVGEGTGGITDRAYVSAPPNFLYVVETARGSFLDCGAGQETRATDEDGRDMTSLRCGVTLTETIIIPAAAESAQITVHY